MGHTACIGKMRSTYNILVRKPGAMIRLTRRRRIWEDNIKMDLKETVSLRVLDSYSSWQRLIAGSCNI
jgi:hypothetical protein